MRAICYKLYSGSGSKVLVITSLYAFTLQALEAFNDALPNASDWNPEVQYFEHQEDGSLLAHMVLQQDADDPSDVQGLEDDLNSAPNKTSDAEFRVGGR
ncbi:unnamed protein product [Clavelina lepadiformis]|uniref:Uncharacterized protein n=1 Tax=Clavelina lepadiformis TaxID=159417 RepID=A0ABP0FR86_CLALP